MFSHGVLNEYVRAAIVSFSSEDKRRESDRWMLMVMLNVTTRDNQEKLSCKNYARFV